MEAGGRAPATTGTTQGVDGCVGSALVVGGGIGGIQAALDLAEAGIKVYLVERGPAIGGTMAALDKTFPTNDCAMCILSPKLVECGRHLNIEILTCAELEGLSGTPGRFTARVRQHPRYVRVEDCTGCGDCATACPVRLPDLFNAGLSERRAAYKLYPQAIPNAYAIEKRGRSPCRDACPIHQRAQGYVALVHERRFADAYRTIREDNPFPSVCGRVCNHRCEEACSRAQVDAPVAIMHLKRFVADWAWENGIRPTLPPALQRHEGDGARKRVAVVGAGPAGLTCAQDLALAGHAVTVFERLPVAGGMMRVGIPAFRLPRERLEREIQAILELGVELRLRHPVADAATLLKPRAAGASAADGNGEGEFDAVFVAVGAHAGMRLPIPGADLPEVAVATDFLREVALEEVTLPVAGRRVLVLGGGNVAVDTAATALRLGAAWVGMACLESREKMPAHAWEIEDLLAEGAALFPARTFKEIVASPSGHVAGVRCAEIEFHGFADGRPDFDERPGTQHVLEADCVIFAIGQRPEVDCLPEGARAHGRRAVADPVTLATPIAGLFAGGDVVTGTTFVVDAIAAGHRAARSIDAYLRGEPLPTLEEPPEVARLTEAEARASVLAGRASPEPRQQPEYLPPAERVKGFGEVYRALNEEQAVAEAGRCLSCGQCSECLQCVLACQKGCIDHTMRPQTVELEVGAVLLAPGLEPVPGDIRPELGYRRCRNVVTSIEFERMLSASGPFGGQVQRPSDGRHPRRIAFIQCVGSRDPARAQGYCSSICCMATAKEAVIAKEHDPAVEATVFYMDVRSYGKGFERYVEGAQRAGVRYIRSMVSTVTEIPGSAGDLRVRYATPDGKNTEEVFDLVVLAVGLRPSRAAYELARRLGVALDEHGFARPAPAEPGCALANSERTLDGVFVAGPFSGPKDIPETVTEASCAAARVSALLAGARGTLTEERVWPAERDVSDEPPRVGVFICHCGINIGAVVDVPAVVEAARALPDVVWAERNLYTCSQDTQEHIIECIREQRLNRVVVASCTPRTHEPLFQETLRAAGLNPHLFEMANIREHVSWVHRAAGASPTEKALELVRMAVAKARRLRPITHSAFEVVPHALVIGGGLAGMTAALAIAKQGFGVTLVEREPELGGQLRYLHRARDGTDPQALLARARAALAAEPRARVLTGTQVERVSGYVGQYRSVVRLADGAQEEMAHGVIVVATGAQATIPRQYLYGQHPRVVTQRELEARLQGGALAGARSVVMIQCVGSRDAEHPYCSRVCCTAAVQNALALKALDPQQQVTILYRDIRTYGLRERYYDEARQQGVLFLEFDPAQPPVVRAAGERLAVEVAVQPEGEWCTMAADWLVLSSGISPNPDNGMLAELLKVPLTEDRFFMEAHVKLRPLEFAADGVYLCGLAHSPRFLDETIAQAHGAAVRAVALLAKPCLEATPIVARVNPRLCAACGLCVETCPYGARALAPDARTGRFCAEVIEVLCQGCGACIAACPNKASQQRGFEADQVLAMLDAVRVAVEDT